MKTTGIIVITTALALSFTSFISSVTPDYTVGGAVPTTGQAVDLGLPSGTLWAPWNVGATKPSEAGAYFAWGETQAKTNYSWMTYKWITNRTGKIDDLWHHINKYQRADDKEGDWFDDLFYFTGDGKSTLDPEDDAATANWGAQWKTPTKEQIYELFNYNNCSREWKTKGDNVAGVLFTSKRNGKRLFLPAAGCRVNYELRDNGTNGFYASSQMISPYTPYLLDPFLVDPHEVGNTIYYDHEVCIQWSTDKRCQGATVRPVLVKTKKR